MRHSGADWLRRNLVYAEQRGDRAGKRRITSTLSPLGVTVAEALGYVTRGIYHMDVKALLRADWSDERCIEVAFHEELATWDYDTLTVLVVVCYDLGLRLAIHPHGLRQLRLSFSQRTTREGDISRRMPPLDERIAAIRSGYRVLPPEEMEPAVGREG